MHWSSVPIHFIDFEGNLTSGILEYGVVTLRGNQVGPVLSRVCGAVGRIRSSDTAVHGLDERAVAGQAPFAEDFDLFAGLRETGPLGAHYAHAENTLIKSAWPYPRASPDFARPGASHNEWGPWIDTGRLYTQLFSALPSGKLEDLVASFGLSDRLATIAKQYCLPDRCHYHAALFDALAAALLFLSLAERPEFKDMTIPWLLQMSTLNPERRASMQQGDLF